MDRVLSASWWTGRRFATAVFIVYAAVTLGATLNHEPWNDEADVWLVMRDGGLGTLLEQTSYGHRGAPVLWFLTIWPFAAGGAPYLTQQLLNLGFCWLGVALVVWRAPFPRVVRALFAFSYYPAFEYAVLARPYALTMTLLFAAAAIWRDRARRPMLLGGIVALLANATVHGLILAAALGLGLLLEWLHEGIAGGRRLAGLSLMAAGGIVAAAQLWPRPGGQVSLYRVEIETVWYSLANAFFPDLRVSLALLPSGAILLLVAAAIGRRLVPQLFLWLSGTLLMAVFVFVWVGGLRHTGILLLAALAALWIANSYGPLRFPRLLPLGLALSLSWGVLPAADAWRKELRQPYSGSRDLARYLRASGLDRKEIAAHRPLYCAPPLVYLPGVRFWWPGAGEYGTYARWDRAHQKALEVPAVTVVERAKERFAGQEWLLLLNFPLPEELAGAFRLVYRTPEAVWGKPAETYWLYRPAGTQPPSE